MKGITQMILKFRAWDRINKKLRYNVTGFEHGEDNEMVGVFLDGYYFGMKLEATVMQYTGLKDTNGKEIYEGDIIKMSNHGIAHVIFEEGGFKYVWLNKPWKYIRKKEFIYNAHLCEVVGNIYENKDLLTQ